MNPREQIESLQQTRTYPIPPAVRARDLFFIVVNTFFTFILTRQE